MAHVVTPGASCSAEMKGVRPWQPILDGPLREQAWAAIEAIAASLRAPVFEVTYLPERFHPVAAAALPGGTAGLAVFYAYLAQARPRRGDEETAVCFLQQAADAVADAPMRAALHGGFTGIAWSVAHLLGGRIDLGEDPNDEIDQALLELLARSPWSDDYDLISGLVGFGVYALERLPRPAAVECLERVIDRLDRTAERQPEGITWATPPERLPADERDQYPEGAYCLGVAHGVAGVIALLGGACAAGVAPDRARPLLEGTVAWLLHQQLESEKSSRFPYWVGGNVTPVPARSAWCHGDPGIAAALLCAAQSVGEPAWEREALTIARRAAHRPPAQTGANDAGLCHGAAGLGHLFNRMFQATGDVALKEAARLWFERTLAMRHPSRGIAGFSALAIGGEDGSLGWRDDPGVLMGAAGIALALLGATTPIEPAWDRTMLVSVPAPTHGVARKEIR